MMHRFQVVFAAAPGALQTLEVIGDLKSKQPELPELGVVVSVKDLGGYLNPSQEWLSQEEASVYLGVDPWTIWDMASNEFIPKAVNGRSKWTRRELDEGLRKKMGLIKDASLKRKAA